MTDINKVKVRRMVKKKKEPESIPEKDYGTDYTEIYYKGGKLPYNHGKKTKVTLLSERVGKLNSSIKVVLVDGKWQFNQ